MESVKGEMADQHKSIRIIVPISERGNSSSHLRMVHRQWYRKLQRELNEGNKIKKYIIQDNIRKAIEIRVKIELEFVLPLPVGKSKASTQERFMKLLINMK